MAPRLLRDLPYALLCRSVAGILFLGVTLHSASCGGGAGALPSQPAPVEQDPSPVLKPWALLLYDDARFNGYDPLNDFANAVASSPNLHVVVLRGTVDGPTYAWYVDEHQAVHRLRGFDAFDTGHPHTFAMSDPDTFETFAHYVQTAFPAERYVVAYYDHGLGWAGCCVDVTAGPTANLSMHAIRTGLAALGHVDAVLFTAPCLMGAVESAYELRDVADVYVGSEQTSGFVYWNGAPLARIRNALSDTPDVSAVDLAGGGVRAIEQNASSIPQYAGPLTMSAIRLAQVSGVRLAVDDLVKALRSDAGAENDLDAVAADVQKYGDSSIVDLFDLTRRLAATSSNRAVRARAVGVQAAIERTVIAETHGADCPDSHGLSILFPRAAGVAFPSAYDDPSTHLDFAADSQWDELLREYQGHGASVLRPWSASPAGNGFFPLLRGEGR